MKNKGVTKTTVKGDPASNPKKEPAFKSTPPPVKKSSFKCGGKVKK